MLSTLVATVCSVALTPLRQEATLMSSFSINDHHPWQSCRCATFQPWWAQLSTQQDSDLLSVDLMFDSYMLGHGRHSEKKEKKSLRR